MVEARFLHADGLVHCIARAPRPPQHTRSPPAWPIAVYGAAVAGHRHQHPRELLAGRWPGHCIRAARGLYGFRLAALTEIALATILFIANQKLRLFIPTAPAVAGVASGLLLWVAAYHLADASQALWRLRAAKLSHHRRPWWCHCVLCGGWGWAAALPAAFSDTGCGQHGNITRFAFGRAAPWHVRHRSGVCGDAVQGSSAFNAPRIQRRAVCGKVTERWSLAQLAGDIERCAMALQYMLHDGQPRPVPPVSAGSG